MEAASSTIVCAASAAAWVCRSAGYPNRRVTIADAPDVAALIYERPVARRASQQGLRVYILLTGADFSGKPLKELCCQLACGRVDETRPDRRDQSADLHLGVTRDARSGPGGGKADRRRSANESR